MSVVVVGAGVAGFSAALSARSVGADVLVIDAAASATSLAGGAWDIATDPMGSISECFRPTRTVADRVADVRRDHPHHPYARLGVDPVGAVAEAHDPVLAALGIYRPLDLDTHGLLVATELGLPRRTATAQKTVLSLEHVPGGVLAVARLRGYREGDARFQAASLADQADLAGAERHFAAVDVEFFRRRSDALLHPHEVAALLDGAEGRAALVRGVSRAITGLGFGGLLLPPVLGLTDDTVAGALTQQLSVSVGETLASLAGPQGLRLDRRIRRALEEAGCRLRNARVSRIAVEGGVARLTLSGGEELNADAVVLATGKLVGGGIELWEGLMREPLAGLPMYADGRSAPLPSSPEGPDPVVLFGDDPFRRGAGYRHGVGYDTRLRALGSEGEVVSENLFVAGALLDGFDPADGTGLGCCATTGWIAGRSAAA